MITVSRTASVLIDSPVAYPSQGANRAAHLGEPHQSLATHLDRLGPRPPLHGPAGSAFIRDLSQAKLTGRGGAHFPAAHKWQAAVTAGGGGVVVVNGAEGEPLSAKDATLLQLRPHLLLDGLAAAAEATRASETVIWLADDAHGSVKSLRLALAERAAAGLADPPVRLAAALHRYVSGESSAVERALAGGAALPVFRRRKGLGTAAGGGPLLVHNVETLARTGLLCRALPGATATGYLVTVVLAGQRVVLEANAAATFAQVLARAGWPQGGAPGLLEPQPQAVLLGGFGGTWVSWGQVQQLVVDQPAVRAAGLSLGAGIVAPITAGACGVLETSRILSYLAAQGAQQCGPCMFGLPELAGLFQALALGSLRSRERRRLDELLGAIPGRGACQHPDGAVRLAGSALRCFAADVDSHTRSGRCLHPSARPQLPVPGASSHV